MISRIPEYVWSLIVGSSDTMPPRDPNDDDDEDEEDEEDEERGRRTCDRQRTRRIAPARFNFRCENYRPLSARIQQLAKIPWVSGSHPIGSSSSIASSSTKYQPVR
jgi:hypothetical protein